MSDTLIAISLAAERHLRAGSFSALLAHQSSGSTALPRIEYMQGGGDATGFINSTATRLATGLLLVTPVAQDEAEANALAREVLNHMPITTELTEGSEGIGHIAGPIRVAGTQREAGTFRIPITIPFTN